LQHYDINTPKTPRQGGKNELRLAVVIRNADSGKLMGVGGRRVAVVEQLTNTIISFAPVPPGHKERTLTINGNTQMELERARVLIVETIQRNMSPLPMQVEMPLSNDIFGAGEVDKSAIHMKHEPADDDITLASALNDVQLVNAPLDDGGPVMQRSVYTREYVLQCADSGVSRVKPAQLMNRAADDYAPRVPPAIAHQ